MNQDRIAIISAAIRAWEESEGLPYVAPDRGRLLTVIAAALNAYVHSEDIS